MLDCDLFVASIHQLCFDYLRITPIRYEKSHDQTFPLELSYNEIVRLSNRSLYLIQASYENI